MAYKNQDVARIAKALVARAKKGENVLRSAELKSLFDQIKTLPANQRGAFGKEINVLRQELETLQNEQSVGKTESEPIDVTAPWDVNSKPPTLLTADRGSIHPLMAELNYIVDIFYRMGFVHMNSREIDDDYHMFGSLNFPEGHPARDDYDTFMTDEGLIAPAHVSIMQNRLQKKYRANLEKGEPIAVVYPGRTFRNEDVDARHEHTFYQVELSYINKNVNVGNLIATIKEWFTNYFGKELEIKVQPFYFPFTEPSFEFAASCIFCNRAGCNVCSYSGWIELGGCGMIHPNVLREGGIDPKVYSGFAGGFGLERMVMLKYNIEDVRHFESGKLEFLRQFA